MRVNANMKKAGPSLALPSSPAVRTTVIKPTELGGATTVTSS